MPLPSQMQVPWRATFQGLPQLCFGPPSEGFHGTHGFYTPTPPPRPLARSLASWLSTLGSLRGRNLRDGSQGPGRGQARGVGRHGAREAGRAVLR